jgi:CBS-domain-containing membrane protein
MTTSAHRRTNIVAFLLVVVLSAATMLWLFWHHPFTTALATIAVLGGFAISARLARWIDTEPRSDLEHKQSA